MTAQHELFRLSQTASGESLVMGPAAPDPPDSGVDTSRSAAMKMKPLANRLRRRVYEAIRSRGPRGATEPELETALRLSGNTLRPRLWELEKAELITKSAQKRPTPTGGEARAYVAREDG